MAGGRPCHRARELTHHHDARLFRVHDALRDGGAVVHRPPAPARGAGMAAPARLHRESRAHRSRHRPATVLKASHMNILGISAFFHDAAAALVQDGTLVAAAEEERFSRIKHDPEFPQLAIDFCLRTGNITAEDLDYVVFYKKPFLKFERILMSTL